MRKAPTPTAPELQADPSSAKLDHTCNCEVGQQEHQLQVVINELHQMQGADPIGRKQDDEHKRLGKLLLRQARAHGAELGADQYAASDDEEPHLRALWQHRLLWQVEGHLEGEQAHREADKNQA